MAFSSRMKLNVKRNRERKEEIEKGRSLLQERMMMIMTRMYTQDVSMLLS